MGKTFKDKRKFDNREMRKGMRVEEEHRAVVKSAQKRKKMVEEHLEEDPKYYSKLAKIFREKREKRK